MSGNAWFAILKSTFGIPSEPGGRFLHFQTLHHCYEVLMGGLYALCGAPLCLAVRCSWPGRWIVLQEEPLNEYFRFL